MTSQLHRLIEELDREEVPVTTQHLKLLAMAFEEQIAQLHQALSILRLRIDADALRRR